MKLSNKGYRFKDIAWRDLFLIPIIFITMMIFSRIGVNILNTHYIHIDRLMGEMVATVAQTMSYVIAILCFYFMHISSFSERLKNGINYIKKHWKFLIVMFIISICASKAYEWMMELLPQSWQFNETQNELALNQLFKTPLFLPITFILIVIVGPIVEEIVFRHIIIGELGKKFNFIFMGIISAVTFSLIHVSDAKSPLEFGAYFILAVILVFVYLKSNRNLASSITIHMLNNLLSFIITIYTISM
ncbi:CPBP family intramembrane glutamic endopeptidase [Staphylococcus warneri]|uniref:CPBP family intramembrane glutamic endopeptidase n=1 Tax=Staphylococcus warneri TaxID=1292 RepID=UPI00119F4112|nr:CPBP family intramembrane glutamic endopeptidase [Staphylococcus warneri]